MISVSCLALDGYSSVFDINSVSIKYDVDVIYVRTLVDNLYLVEPIILMQINSNESNHGIRVIKFLKPIIASSTDPLTTLPFRCATLPIIFSFRE